MDLLCFCSVLCLLCACLFICALWSPAGKGLTSWLSFVVSSVSLSLSHWYPGSGVVLDCIDSWSLHHYLLLKSSRKSHILRKFVILLRINYRVLIDRGVTLWFILNTNYVYTWNSKKFRKQIACNNDESYILAYHSQEISNNDIRENFFTSAIVSLKHYHTSTEQTVQCTYAIQSVVHVKTEPVSSLFIMIIN